MTTPRQLSAEYSRFSGDTDNVHAKVLELCKNKLIEIDTSGKIAHVSVSSPDLPK